MKFCFLFLLCTAAAQAALTVAPIYTPHMVLQRGAAVPICGTTDSNTPVTVEFAGQHVKAQLKNGKWKAELRPMEACAEGRTLSITQGNETVELPDVLVGEVWLASGQSNMLWRLNQTGDTAALNDAGTSNSFRFFHSEPAVNPAGGRFNPELCARLERGEMYSGTWTADTPKSRARMSAVGYYFGQNLQRYIGVPVGVIHCSVGGSEMLAWLPKGTKLPASFETKQVDRNPAMGAWVRKQIHENIGNAEGPHPYMPHYLFENGIRRWQGFPIAGVIWYQGEADSELTDNRTKALLLKSLVNSWREFFNSDRLPFLMVQLPRINYPKWPLWPQFRQLQQDAALRMKGVECCVTIDLGSTNGNVHPPKKAEVGRRLAALAAKRHYGQSSLAAEGPTVQRHAKDFSVITRRSGREISVTFDKNAEGLHTTDSQAPRCFEISEDGQHFVPAQARIEGSNVILRADGLTAPRHVRYAWATFVNPNLVNKANLPAAPFNSAWQE